MRALTMALLLLGCDAEAQSTHSTTNPEVAAQLLFEHEGCRVYRFYDGRAHYYVRCPDRLTALETQCHSQGKTVVCHGEEVETAP